MNFLKENAVGYNTMRKKHTSTVKKTRSTMAPCRNGQIKESCDWRRLGEDIWRCGTPLKRAE
jgi:hypothetical protein